MTRLCMWLAGLSLLLLAGWASRLEAQDPEFAGRRGSEWVQLLKEDSSARKRKAAVVALGQLWKDRRYAQSIPSIGQALQQDPNAEVRLQAAVILGQLSRDDVALTDEVKPVVSQLVGSLLAEKDSAVRREIARALGRYGELSKAGVLALTKTLEDSDASTRSAAAEALGRIGPDARSATSVLLKLLDDAEGSVKRSAAFALTRIRPEEVEAVGSQLVRLLKQERDVDLRREILVGLGLLGDHSASTALALADVLTDPDAELRRQAAQALAKFGPALEPAVAPLLQAFQTDPDKNVRIDALRALGNGLGLAMQKHIPLLAARLSMEGGEEAKGDPDFEVRIAITDELGALGPGGKEAVPALRRALRDPQVKVREAAAAAIKKIEAPIEKKP